MRASTVIMKILLIFISAFANQRADSGSHSEKIPFLKKQGDATQIVVDGKPYLILGGELGNSTASDLEYLRPYWQNFVKMNLNTILCPVYWELIESGEGEFDFTLVDSIIYSARRYDLKLVLLWFGSVLRQLEPLILANQGKETMMAVLLDSTHHKSRVSLGNYAFNVRHEYSWPYAQRSEGETPRVGGMILMLAADEFLVAGSGIVVTFETLANDGTIAGIERMDEGRFINGDWTPGRRMNGDQSHQGRHMHLPGSEFGIQRVKLYTYK